ncbi:MAG: PTS sugar transporter subunit IIB [Bulleidia sp.]|nr:PTS sugar transporter subunit IIB [Erysipelotrichaceae bacterium]MDD6663407.1 PTS sugar transporter subunit IIB [Bulleidia sp.]HAW12970.1 PTS mannose/fructose/sorbose transporter subunit IIB [Erysipelotrichaceae bacterium]
MIKALRIDHRLVHGQVAFTWTHFLAATRIIVIDDKAAADEFQKMALNMAKPAGCKLNVFSVDKALERAEKIDSLTDSVFIIFGSTKDAAGYITGHPVFKELNLGGVAKKEGSRNYADVVYLTPEEEDDIRAIMATGCKVFMQQLPTTKRESLTL